MISDYQYLLSNRVKILENIENWICDYGINTDCYGSQYSRNAGPYIMRYKENLSTKFVYKWLYGSLQCDDPISHKIIDIMTDYDHWNNISWALKRDLIHCCVMLSTKMEKSIDGKLFMIGPLNHLIFESKWNGKIPWYFLKWHYGRKKCIKTIKKMFPEKYLENKNNFSMSIKVANYNATFDISGFLPVGQEKIEGSCKLP